MLKSQKQEANSQPQLKVCGLTKLSQICELVALKVDFIGFVFYEQSPRFVLNHLGLDDIAKINHQGKVGVFVNESVEKIIEISENADLNSIQLHGDENEEYIIRLRQMLNENIKIIKVIRIGNHNIDDLQKTISKQPSTINYLLFDTDSKAFGGTGKTFDWNILNVIKIPFPYFLSGGISLENVENINNLVQKPFVLDINSKFETKPGIKDLEKIKKFINTLKSPKGTT